MTDIATVIAEEQRDAALARIASLLAALEREAEHEPVVRVLLRRMPEVAAARSALEASAVPPPLDHGYSPRPTWAGTCPRCGAEPGTDCAVLTGASAVPEPTDLPEIWGCHQHNGWHHHGGFKHLAGTQHPAADHKHDVAAPPGPHTSREDQIERIAAALCSTGDRSYETAHSTTAEDIDRVHGERAAALYAAGLRAEPSREAEATFDLNAEGGWTIGLRDPGLTVSREAEGRDHDDD